ncbi:unnamed protein product [Mycena citricolor]|uniref:F-box domain-containing protein n=1 Tax=Mycena citricolor TaxID=2018698 RepID=A0AAD2HG58_9AGAR|nr:unnamed protein product [Mycena citricolor]
MIEWSTPARRSGHRSLSLIPNEVYLEIFAYLEPRDGYGTLDARESNHIFVNLSRVCRLFCAASLTALYRRVRFSARNEDHTARTRGMNPDALCALLVRRPPRDAMDTFGRSSASEIELAKMIASWVRECVFDAWAEPRGRIPYAHLFLERNWRAVRRMSGLTALTLRSTPITKALLRTLSALSGTLKRLSLRACALESVLTDKQSQWLDSLRLDVLEVFETFESWEDIPLEAIRLKDIVEFRTDSWPYAEHFLKSSYSRLRCLELHDVSDIPLLLRFLEKAPTLHALTVQSIMTDHSETPRVELDSETLPQLDALTVPPMLLQFLSRGTVRTLSLLGEESHLYDEEIAFFPQLRALTETDLASLFRSEAPACIEGLAIPEHLYSVFSVHSRFPSLTCLVLSFDHQNYAKRPSFDFLILPSSLACLWDLQLQKTLIVGHIIVSFPQLNSASFTSFVKWELLNHGWHPYVLQAERSLVKSRLISGKKHTDVDGCFAAVNCTPG